MIFATRNLSQDVYLILKGVPPEEARVVRLIRLEQDPPNPSPWVRGITVMSARDDPHPAALGTWQYTIRRLEGYTPIPAMMLLARIANGEEFYEGDPITKLRAPFMPEEHQIRLDLQRAKTRLYLD